MKKSVNFFIILQTLSAINILASANDIILPEKIDNNATSITHCIKHIINNHCDTVIVLVNTTVDENKEFIKNMLQTSAKLEIPLIVTDKLELKTNLFHRDLLIVLYLNKCEDILGFNWTSLIISIKHLVITSLFCKDDIKAIGEAIDTLAVTFILMDDSKRHGLITFIPQMTAGICEVNTIAEPVQINTCYNSTLIGMANVFPAKNPEDLQGCPLKIGLHSFPPYATVDDAQNASGYDELEKVHGSDVELLKIIAKKVNASLRFHFLTANDRFENNVCLNFLKNGSLDLCAGGVVRYTIKHDHLVCTETYNTQGLIWIYTAKRTHTYWERIKSRINHLYPFLVFYLCYCTLYNVISYNEGQRVTFRDTLFYGWGAFFGTAVLPRHTSWKHTILNMFYLISAFYVFILLTKEVTSLLIVELPPKIYQNHDEIESSGLKSFLNPAWNYSGNKNMIQLLNISSACIETRECEKKALENEGMTLIMDGHFKLFQIETAVNFEVQMLKVPENVRTIYIVIVMRKDLYVYERVRHLVSLVFESGIYQKLYNNELGLNTIAKSHKFSKNLRRFDHSCKMGCKINLEKIMPTFYTWMVGCTLSLFVFMLEVLSKNND